MSVLNINKLKIPSLKCLVIQITNSFVIEFDDSTPVTSKHTNGYNSVHLQFSKPTSLRLTSTESPT